MSAAGWLEAAKFGMDVLGAYNKYTTAQTNAELASISAEMEGEMERYQVKRQAQNLAERRRRRFADFMGTQRASQATAGVAGGRTTDMLEAESQNQFSRQMQEDEASEAFKLAASRRQERMKKVQARFSEDRAKSQFTMDIFSSALGSGKEAVGVSEAAKALG